MRTFGLRMKQVPTSASREIAAQAIRESYTGLVDAPLLEKWITSPARAPGRPVSSPWPERIEVTSSTHSNLEATVGGIVVEATSTGEGRRIPIQIQLRRSGDSWLITAYEATEKTAPVVVQDQTIAPDIQAAIDVVHQYYQAISSGEFERAYRYWGESGPPGQTLQSFVAGFRETASVQAKTHVPSRIEPAAGSRYIEVPVTIIATTKDGRLQRYEGTYTLRRTVVDGAPPSAREWHLYRASIREVKGVPGV